MRLRPPKRSFLGRFENLFDKLAPVFAGALLWAVSGPVIAAGAEAGSVIANTAYVNFELGGVAQPAARSNTVQTPVNELLDVATVVLDGSSVAVPSPATDAVLTFTVRNTGNGQEAMRLTWADDINEGGFDPATRHLYLEANGVPGLQVGGGDPLYVEGADDPLLLPEESVTVYLVSDIPSGVARTLEGAVELRATPVTIVEATGLDDPAAVGFPQPGTAFPGRGDTGVEAIVGLSHSVDALVGVAPHSYRIAGIELQVAKDSTVADTAGGNTVVPGSTVNYQVRISAVGVGTLEQVAVRDVLPVELNYVAGSLIVDGQSEDDDFLPAGTDNAGFDPATGAISVDLGAMSAGDADVLISFATEVR